MIRTDDLSGKNYPESDHVRKVRYTGIKDTRRRSQQSVRPGHFDTLTPSPRFILLFNYVTDPSVPFQIT